ncbi:MAG: DUF3786 domain-containing protein [Deltaproteobacteria bacterium]|nr:DUF3786 domain-containing protein [Deltaproteobacteria bacterium]
MTTDLVAPIHFRELMEKDPGDVCQRSGCRFDSTRRCYDLEFWGDVYHIHPHEHRIRRFGEEVGTAHEYLYVFLIHYLLTTAEIVAENEWISEKDIPGGSTFFRGPHSIPTDRVTRTYQNDLAAFGRRCRELHGEPVEMGDAAFRFQITKRLPVVVLYWQGDDDFPPEARLLFDRSFCKLFALDVVFALAVEICARIGGSGNKT